MCVAVMWCSTLQYTATHCSTLHHTASHCNTLQHTATHCNKLNTHSTRGSEWVQRASLMGQQHVTQSLAAALAHLGLVQVFVLQCVATCCSMPQCIALCCSVLHCVAVCCSPLLPHLPIWISSRYSCCSVLQGVAGCCSVLQRVAACCSVLQRVVLCDIVLQSLEAALGHLDLV